MIIQGTAGPQVIVDGSPASLRQGRGGELIASELHGKYYEQSYRGNVFMYVTAVTALQANASTTGAPLILQNPTSSGKNLSIVRTVLAIAALPGTQVAGAFAYYTLVSGTNPVSATAGTAQAAIIGGNPAVAAKVYSAGTLSAAPTLAFPIAGKPGTAAAASSPLRIVDEPDGAFLLGPGTQLTIQETVADTTSNYSASIGIIWEEIPV